MHANATALFWNPPQFLCSSLEERTYALQFSRRKTPRLVCVFSLQPSDWSTDPSMFCTGLWPYWVSLGHRMAAETWLGAADLGKVIKMLRTCGSPETSTAQWGETGNELRVFGHDTHSTPRRKKWSFLQTYVSSMSRLDTRPRSVILRANSYLTTPFPANH